MSCLKSDGLKCPGDIGRGGDHTKIFGRDNHIHNYLDYNRKFVFLLVIINISKALFLENRNKRKFIPLKLKNTRRVQCIGMMKSKRVL